MFIGDGAKMVRDTFALAKEKAPEIIFIDELDPRFVHVFLSCFVVKLLSDIVLDGVAL